MFERETNGVNGMRYGFRPLTAAVILAALMAGAACPGDIRALAESEQERYFDEEDGVWVTPGAEMDGESFIRGYLKLKRGAVVYYDKNRKQPMGYPLEESVVYAERVRAYEKGSLYELRFDTAGTADGESYVKAYYYTREPDAAGTSARAEALGSSPGARIVDGVPLTVIRFHYGAETQNEQRFNIITATGTGYIAHDSTNLRKGPGSTYEYITRLSRDTRVTVTGMVTNGVGATWLYVRDDEGNEGFVRNDMVASAPVGLTQVEAPAEGETPIADPAEDTPESQEDGPPAEASLTEDTEPEEEPPLLLDEAGGQEAPEALPLPEAEQQEDGGEAAAQDERDAAPDGRSVRVAVTWQGESESPSYGDYAVLRAVLQGYEGKDVALQWQTSRDGARWNDIHGANSETLTLQMTEENCRDYWRVLVTTKDSDVLPNPGQ